MKHLYLDINEEGIVHDYYEDQKTKERFYVITQENLSIDEKVRTVYRTLICLLITQIRKERNLTEEMFSLKLADFLREKGSHYFWGHEIYGVAFFNSAEEGFAAGSLRLDRMKNPRKILINDTEYDLTKFHNPSTRFPHKNKESKRAIAYWRKILKRFLIARQYTAYVAILLILLVLCCIFSAIYSHLS